jgi:hypothetical protein
MVHDAAQGRVVQADRIQYQQCFPMHPHREAQVKAVRTALLFVRRSEA